MSNDIINSNKLLFICASPAGGGFRLGRIVSCLNNVYWYSDQRNGERPWHTFFNNPNSVGDKRVTGKDISEFHYDRYINGKTVPLVGERIERYWNAEDLDYFYDDVWTERMEFSKAKDLMRKGLYISWVVHDTPDYIASRFPNAKIINLVESDFSSIVDRYKKTTALFPIVIRSDALKPHYKNDYASNLDKLLKQNPNATYRDYWSYVNRGLIVYDNSCDLDYTKWLFDECNVNATNKESSSCDCLNVSWKSFDIEQIKKYLSSAGVNDRYLDILKKG